MVIAPCKDDQLHPSSLIVDKETAFAKALAGNQKTRRDRSLKRLQKWLEIRSSGPNQFTEEDLMKVWVGLYYSMWMSDKPLIQEELADSLGNLIHCFGANEDAALLFIKCFNVTMSRSWNSLDQHRLDKFAMLIRRFLRQSLIYCQKRGWTFSIVKRVMDVFVESMLIQDYSLGLKLQFIEVFLEELAKVGREDLNPKVTAVLLRPFVKLFATTRDTRVRAQLDTFFTHLIKQTDVAIEYEEKFNAWKRAGCPGGDIDLMVKEEEEADEESGAEDDLNTENEEMGELLDPRAGSVHVVLPQIAVPTAALIKQIKKQVTHPESTLKGRTIMLTLAKHFRMLKKGKYPFAMNKKIKQSPKFSNEKNINKLAKKLIKETTVKKKSKAQMKAYLKKINADFKKARENPEVSEDIADTPKAKKRPLKETDLEEQIDIPQVIKSPSKKKQKTCESEDNENQITVNGENDIQEKSSSKKKRKASVLETKENEPVGKSENSPLGSPSRNQRSRKNSGSEDDGAKVEKRLSPTSASPKKSPLAGNQTGNSPSPKSSPKSPQPSGLTSTKPVKKVVNGFEFELKGNSGGWLVEEVPTDAPVTPQKVIKIQMKGPDSSDDEDPWAEPLKEGEYEVFVPKKRITPTPVFWDYAKAKVSSKSKPSTPTAKALMDEIMRPSSGRRISINLERNMAQETREHWESVQKSPQIPFNAEKKPPRSALKPGLVPSPINPFYKKRFLNKT